MRLFVEELKSRSYILFIIGLLYILGAVFSGSFLFFERNIHYSVSIPLRVTVGFLSSFITIWSLGWMNEYLYQKSNRRFFSYAYAGIFLVIWVLTLVSVIRGIIPKPNAEFTYDRIAAFFILLAETGFALLILNNTRKFFIQQKMPVSQHYTWGVRLGYLIFLVPVIINSCFHLIDYFSLQLNLPNLAAVMQEWDNPVGGLRLAYIMGISALQIIPLTSNYYFNKKKEVLVFALTYFISMLLLSVMTFLSHPLRPA